METTMPQVPAPTIRRVMVGSMKLFWLSDSRMWALRLSQALSMMTATEHVRRTERWRIE
jgi:hypothetical protein